MKMMNDKRLPWLVCFLGLTTLALASGLHYESFPHFLMVQGFCVAVMGFGWGLFKTLD